MAEFAKGRQASIEKELLFNKTFEEAKTLFRDGRFEDAVAVVESGLKAFPGNVELENLGQQAETQQKKLDVRRQIEKRIREIKVRINREELSEAIDLAKQTLVTMGPDTDITHLLNSAQIEYQSREQKKIQEETLLSIDSLVESGHFNAASQTIKDALESRTLDSFDPRVQRVSELIKNTTAKTESKEQPAVPTAFSKEYAFLQLPPPGGSTIAGSNANRDVPITQLSATSVTPAYTGPKQDVPPLKLEPSVSPPQEPANEPRPTATPSPVTPEKVATTAPLYIEIPRSASQKTAGSTPVAPFPLESESGKNAFSFGPSVRSSRSLFWHCSRQSGPGYASHE